jgi:hypothetical protein
VHFPFNLFVDEDDEKGLFLPDERAVYQSGSEVVLMRPFLDTEYSTYR